MATPATVADVAYNAGVRDRTNLIRAIAIAFAESGFNERAHNPVPPDDSYGLWQINMYGSLGPARRQKYGLTANSDLYNPVTNAKAMYDISGGGKNWKPWTTYQGARYTLALPAATLAADARLVKAGAGAVAGGVVEGTQDAVSGLLTPVQAAGEALNMAGKAGAWLSNRNNWFRIAKVGVGLALVSGGVFLATKPITAKAGKVIVQTALPIGKAGKAIAAAGAVKGGK